MAKPDRPWHQDSDIPDDLFDLPFTQSQFPPFHQTLYQALRKQLALNKRLQSPLVATPRSFEALNLTISVSTVSESVLQEFSEFKRAVGWASSHSKREKIQEFKQFSKKLEGAEPDVEEIPESLVDLYLANWENSDRSTQSSQWPVKPMGNRTNRRHDTSER